MSQTQPQLKFDAMPDCPRTLSFVPVENPQPRTLASAQIDFFNSQGYLFPLDVFTTDEIGAIREYFNWLMQQALEKGWNSYSINGWHRQCKSLFDLVRTPKIADYIADLLGPDLLCWGTHFFCKMPGDTKKVSWHQDASYWPLTPSKTVTVWLALDDVDEENGAMKVIPGSHLAGQIPFKDSGAEEDNVLWQTVPDAENWGQPVSVELKAGQISLHSDLLLHGSEPNPSRRRRCGLTMRFVPPEVRSVKGDWGNAVLCCGTCHAAHWRLIERPEGERIPDRK